MTSRVVVTASHGSTSMLLFTREYTRYFVRAAELIIAGLILQRLSVLKPERINIIDEFYHGLVLVLDSGWRPRFKS